MTTRPTLRLTQLHLERLPGIDTPFAVPAQPGVNLISGPNESGKSSVARAVFQLLWPGTPAGRPFMVRGEFADHEGELQARRLDDEPVVWTRHGEPTSAPVVPGAHLVGCYRLGLLDLNRAVADGDLDQDLAREIRKQMAGGFDLDAVVNLFPQEERLLRLRRRDMAEAEQELQRHQGEQRHLIEEEKSLSELTAEKARAELATRQADQLAAAAEHQTLVAGGKELAAQLATLPAGMERVRPGDAETLDDLLQRRAKNSQQIAAWRDEITQSTARLAELNSGGDPAELAHLVREAEAQQVRADEADRALAAATAAVAQARQDLDPELLAADIPLGSRQAFEQLLRNHRRQVAHEAEQNVLQGLLEREALAADKTQPASRRPLLGSLGTLALAAGLLIIGSGRPATDIMANRFFGAALVLVVWGVGGIGFWLRERHNRQRAASPLGELRRELQRRSEQARTAVGEVRARRREILHELGRGDDRDTLELLPELDHLARYRAADEARAAAQGVHDHEQTRLTEMLATARTRLDEMGLPVKETLAAVQAGLDLARERRSEAEGLRKVCAAAEKSLQQAERESTQLAAAHEDLCRRLDLSPTDSDGLAQVQARVAALPRYQQLQTELDNIRRDQERITARLDGGDDLPTAAEVLALTPAALEEQLTTRRELAAHLPGLTESIVQIRERVRLAGKSDALERARSAVAEKAADLAEAVARQRENLLGRLLVERIAQRHEANTQPPVLAAMNDHLTHFTGGRYRLLVTGDNPSRFVALDNSEQRLELAELSDGTRAQLLLAARLAFLNSAESGLQAPLFLDEALTASDPERFAAIAGALGRMAAVTGRQVFYLTSNPADCSAWQQALQAGNLAPAHLINLARQRGLGAAAGAPGLAPTPVPAIPAPGKMTAADYGALIKVPALRPWAHENTVHLFHLLHDELDLLHRLLVGGTATLGQWRRLGNDLARAGVASAEEMAVVAARGQVYGAFLTAWRRGRGRPLTRADLVAGGVFSRKMLEPACRLLDETGPDGATFMAAVQAGGVKGLRTTIKEALQEYLEREEFLDPREMWEPDEIVARVMGTVGATLKPGEVRQLVLRLYQVAVAESS